MDGLVLLSILLAQGISSEANAELQIEGSLAFGGYVSNNGISELRVRAFSRTGGNLVLETSGATHDVRLNLELLPNQATEAWLPLQINSRANSVSLGARLNQFDDTTIPLNPMRRSIRPFALIGSRASQLLAHVPNTISISSTALPHIPEAYSQVSALAVDRQAMAALDEDQLRSLLDYVGTCGRLLLIDVSDAVGQVFANRATCERQYLRFADDEESARGAFIELIEKSDSPLPSNRDLEALLVDSSADAFDLDRIILLWGGYLIILILLLTRTRAPLAALGFCVVSTVLVLMIWPAGTSRNFVAWAEMASSEKMARYIGVERHAANRRGIHLLSRDSFNGYPIAVIDGDFYLDWSLSGDHQQIAWTATPFEQLDRVTQGSFPVDATVQLDLGSTSAGVCNIGRSATAPMYLHWQGDLYEIPSLDSGARWTNTAGVALSRDLRNRPELELFRARSSEHSIAILQSLPVPDAEETERAWLMRYLSHETGESPCAT